MAFYTQQHQDNSLPIPILIFPFSSADVCVYLFYTQRCVFCMRCTVPVFREKKIWSEMFYKSLVRSARNLDATNSGIRLRLSDNSISLTRFSTTAPVRPIERIDKIKWNLRFLCASKIWNVCNSGDVMPKTMRALFQFRIHCNKLLHF